MIIFSYLYEQMCAALFAEAAFRPFGSAVAADVSDTADFRVTGGQGKSRPAAPSAAFAAMTGVYFAVVFDFQRYAAA